MALVRLFIVSAVYFALTISAVIFTLNLGHRSCHVRANHD